MTVGGSLLAVRVRPVVPAAQVLPRDPGNRRAARRKLLGLMFVSLFGILILSNVVTALSSFFLAKDLDLLVAAPVDWLRLYGAKLLETTAHSSWMVVLVATPVLTAYGISYQGGFLYPLIAIAAVIPFLFIPAAIGSAVTLILVNIFPARRTRDILSVIAVLAAAGVVLMFRLVRPERLARPEGFRSLVEFIRCCAHRLRRGCRTSGWRRGS